MAASPSLFCPRLRSFSIRDNALYCLSDGEHSGDGVVGVHSLWRIPIPRHSSDSASDQLWFSDIPRPQWELVLNLADDLKDEVLTSRLFGQLSERRRIFSRGILNYRLMEHGALACQDSAGTLYCCHPSSGRRFAVEFACLDTSFDGTHQVGVAKRDGLKIIDIKTGREHMIECETEDIGYGVSDFIMQEEFRRYNAMSWSPDGSRLLTIRVDTSQISPTFIPSDRSEMDVDMLKFPYAGTPNTISELLVIDAQSGETYFLCRSLRTRFPWYEYLSRFGWFPEGDAIWAQVFDRLQKRTAVVRIPMCEFGIAGSSETWEVLYEYAVQTGWINATDAFEFLNRDMFIWSDETTGFRHLYSFQRDGETFNRRALTSGEWSVCEYETIFVHGDYVFFQGRADGHLETHLYAVAVTRTNCAPTRLTQIGYSHRTNMILAQDDSLFIIDEFSNALCPTSWILLRVDTALDEITCETVCWICGGPHDYGLLEMTSRDSFAPVVDSCLWPKETPKQLRIGAFTTFVPSLLKYDIEGERIYCAVISSPLDDQRVPRPLILYLYNGPRGQLIQNAFTLHRPLLDQLVARGFIVCFFDGRGTHNRGTKFEQVLDGDLVSYPVHDVFRTIDAVIQEGRSYPDGWIIDETRIMCYGWSFGGMLALRCLMERPDRIRKAISGAPVTDWRLYDTAYTERYLGLHSNENYASSSLMTHVHKLPDESDRVMIVHGMSDDNVLLDNSLRLVDKMNQLNKPVVFQPYLFEKHGFRSREASFHFETALLSFIQR